jgi:hypothetical protein
MAVDSQGEQCWVSLQEAAVRFGLSVDTVRRRVKQGTLESRTAPSRYGPAWQVRMDQLPEPASGPAPASAPPTVELLRMVEQLQERLVQMAERIGYLQGQLQRVQMETATPTERVSE